MVSPITGEAIRIAAATEETDTGTMVADAFGDFLIEASPIRAANAKTAATFAQEVAGGRE